jgi:ABC-type glycerol-3-phosphate transport system substrate-binding protein
MSQKQMTRRGLLKVAGAGLVSGLLAACQPKVVEKIVERTVVVEKNVEKVVKETVVVQGTPQVIEKVVTVQPAASGPTEVSIIMEGWVDSAWAISQRASLYNSQQGDVRVNIIPTAEGWQTKALSQIESGATIWDGYMTHHPFRIGVLYLSQGLIQPIDEYLETSRVLKIDEFWADTIDPEKIKYDCSVKGKVVGIPLGIDTCCQSFRADLMQAADLPYTREDFMKERSWENIQNWAVKLREKNRSDGVWGIVTWQVYHQSLGAIFQSITKDLYDSEGLIRFDSEPMRKALEIQCQWSWSEAAPTPAWGGNTYQSGKSALWQGQVGVPGAAQRVWGTRDIPMSMPVLVDGGTGGNQWYTTCGYALNKAKNPQAAIDFMLWLVGPQNDVHAQKTLEFNWFPIFKSQWTKQVDEKPQNAWAKDFMPQFTNAQLIPRNPYYEIQMTAAQKHCELAQAKKETVEEACTKMMEETKEQISKLKVDW